MINPLAICGHCGNLYRNHQKYQGRDEIFCYPDTSADLWSSEPSERDIGYELQMIYPHIYDELVTHWKRANGHA